MDWGLRLRRWAVCAWFATAIRKDRKSDRSPELPFRKGRPGRLARFRCIHPGSWICAGGRVVGDRRGSLGAWPDRRGQLCREAGPVPREDPSSVRPPRLQSVDAVLTGQLAREIVRPDVASVPHPRFMGSQALGCLLVHHHQTPLTRGEGVSFAPLPQRDQHLLSLCGYVRAVILAAFAAYVRVGRNGTTCGAERQRFSNPLR
jgi:hypothetical protein